MTYQPNIRKDHDLVSPTAKLVAYWRGLSEIPYAKKISEYVNAERTARELLGTDVDKVSKFGIAFIESRYRALDKGLATTGIGNILELAVGVLPRGLINTREKPSTIYVGTDLPEMLTESEKIMRRIITEEKVPRSNLHFIPANAINLKELKKATKPFGKEPFNVANEGLLMYLTRDEQTLVSQNIHTILSKNGGSWVTPDTMDKESRQRRLATMGDEFKEIAQKAMGSLLRTTGRNVMDSSFDSTAQVDEFFGSLGFKVRRIPFYEQGDKIPSLKGMSSKLREDMTRMLKEQQVVIMTPK